MKMRGMLVPLLTFVMPVSALLLSRVAVSDEISQLTNHPKIGDLLANATCAEQVKDLIHEWVPVEHWHPVLSEGISYQSPTKKVGTWMNVEFRSPSDIQATLISATTRTRLNWSSSCIAERQVETSRALAHAADSNQTQTMTDDKVAQLVATGKSGMILAWSPSMPLSYKAYPEAKKLASDMGIMFVPVMDPETNLAHAKVQAKKHGIDEAAVMPIRSVELLARGMMLHYPSVLVFAHGEIKEQLFPGYWDQVSILKKHVERLTQ